MTSGKTSDLVARLREDYPLDEGEEDEAKPLLLEAADEIERCHGWLRYIAQASNDEGSCAQQALSGARVPPFAGEGQ